MTLLTAIDVLMYLGSVIVLFITILILLTLLLHIYAIFLVVFNRVQGQRRDMEIENQGNRQDVRLLRGGQRLG